MTIYPFGHFHGFNPSPPTIMHIDLNSCFASVEQQANPLLRGKPVAVAAYTTGNGCILAASTEAKQFGVATGMRVRDGKALCSDLVVLPSDPWKYRFVNRKLLSLLREYSGDVTVRSIDEMVVNFYASPMLWRVLPRVLPPASAHRVDNRALRKVRPASVEHEVSSKSQINSCALSGSLPPASPALGITEQNSRLKRSDVMEAMLAIGLEIKRRIREEVGEWLTVSVGIAPNRYLAKIASGLHKPDGLDAITRENIEAVLSVFKLEELSGIKKGYGARLRSAGIADALSFYRAPIALLESAFRSVIGYHWWLRLHGWEADDREFDTKSIGHSYALYKPYTPSDVRLHQILCQLVEKAGRRLRMNGFTAQGIYVSCLASDHRHWHRGEKLTRQLSASADLYVEALRVLRMAPENPVRILAVTCFHLSDAGNEQLFLFEETEKKKRLVAAIDAIADRWGEFTVVPARMLVADQKVLDRIAFGGVAGLEEFVFREPVDRDELPYL
jgi:nucleotidyltransferase/DNA polymerase involved in DNA repair